MISGMTDDLSMSFQKFLSQKLSFFVPICLIVQTIFNS